ncbi:MAG: hypothetical protein NTV51_03145 [Verrucomicrobia bacterium]|nr:hypothetical protein [Verrucomicrobiota bacterium]
MNTAQRMLTAYVLDRLEHEPLAKRVELLRALAIVSPDPREQAAWHGLADRLELIEARQRRVVLHFKRRTAG